MFVVDPALNVGAIGPVDLCTVEGDACRNTSPPHRFDYLAASDLHQPRPKLAFITERLQPSKRKQQCRLNHILGGEYRESPPAQPPAKSSRSEPPVHQMPRLRHAE